MTQAENTATSSKHTQINTYFSELCLCSKSPKTKIYIFTVKVFTHFNKITKKMGRKWRSFYKKRSFKREEELSICTRWTFALNKQFQPLFNFRNSFSQIPENIFLNTHFLFNKKGKMHHKYSPVVIKKEASDLIYKWACT